MFSAVVEKTHILKMPNLNVHIDPRGVGYVFYHKMKKFKNNIAQIDGITGKQQTYQLLLERCISTAIAMQKRGIKSTDIICICSDIHLDVILPYFAALFLGAYAVCLNPFSSVQENMYLLKQTDINPKMLFISSNLFNFAEEFLNTFDSEIVVFGDSTKHTSFEYFAKPIDTGEYFKPHEAENSSDVAIMQFSSGSTGSPKLVCISHHAFLGQTEINLKCKNYYERILMFSTLYWGTSITYWAVAILVGGLRITLPRFDGEQLFNIIHHFKPTFMLLSRYYALSIQPKKDCNVGSVKSIGVGGASMTQEQMLRIKKIFPTSKVWSAYGSTETNLITYPHTETEKEEELFRSKFMSCGTGVVGLSYKITHPDTGYILGPNQIGELRIKSNYFASHYYKSKSSFFDSEGWLRTGDLVYYDEDFYFHVVDRLKDLIVTKGNNVYPSFIEHILIKHPSVKEAVVVGKRHPIDGEQPVAVIVTHSNKTITADKLIMFFEANAGAFITLSGGVVFLDSLPLTSTGKISRYLIKKHINEIEKLKSKEFAYKEIPKL